MSAFLLVEDFVEQAAGNFNNQAIRPWTHEGCLRQYYRVDRREIHYLKFILEGYDGLAVMRTVDPLAGLVVLHVPAGCEKDVDAIVDDLKSHMRIEALRPAGQNNL